MPTILRFYRADAYVMKKIAASATAFFEDVRTDPDHPFRGEFDRLILTGRPALDRPGLRKPHRRVQARGAGAARGRPSGAERVGGVRVLVRKCQRRERRAAAATGRRLRRIGRQLAADADMRAEINQGMVVVLRSFVAEQKSGVSRFIADQVKAWDMRQLTDLIELNVGKDLQYIRFNGTLIGGLAGLALHGSRS